MDILRPMLAIALVFGLLAGALWTLRRRGLVLQGRLARNRKGNARLEVIERVALAPQHALTLVRCGDRALLLALHSGGCTLLERLPPAGVWDNLSGQPSGRPLRGLKASRRLESLPHTTYTFPGSELC
jgi:flagellar biosynthetic protein FliO